MRPPRHGDAAGGECGLARRSDRAGDSIENRLVDIAIEAKARSIDAVLFAAASAVALWSCPQDDGAGAMCVPVAVA